MIKMMNKKAEHFAFGVSFLAVLASFMLIVAPTLVAAPQFFPPFPDINPPFNILLHLDCADYGGTCKADCPAEEQSIGAANADNLNCAAKCCKKKNTCPEGDTPFSAPCFNSNDCQDGTCIVIGKEPNRCCSQEKITICVHPGKPEQKTITLPANAFREFAKKELDYKFGPCSATPTPTATPTSTNTPVPTSTPTSTDTPAPTSTPSSTSTPVPTSTPTIVPTSTAVPISTPTTSPTSAPTMTPVPTGSPSPSPSVTP